jgi:hypothetical protein
MIKKIAEIASAKNGKTSTAILIGSIYADITSTSILYTFFRKYFSNNLFCSIIGLGGVLYVK